MDTEAEKTTVADKKAKDRAADRQSMMLTESVGKLIMRMSLPTILSFLITSIYNLADTFFVSSLGTNATAAVSVNQSLDMIVMMGGTMLAIGAASYISRLLGAGEKEQAAKVLSTCAFSALAFGSIILLLGKIFIVPLVDLLGATDTCRQYSVDYANYVLYAAPVMSLSFVLNQSLRSEGAPLYSMVGIGVGGVLNCILDPFFIFDKVEIFGLTLGGLGLEVAGASIATALSKAISLVILLVPYVSRRSMLSLSLRKVSYEKKIVTEVTKVGASSLFRNALSIVAGVVLNNIAGGISDSLLAAIGVSTKIMMFPFGFVLGFGNGFQPVAGFSWGAKNYPRVRASVRFASRAAFFGMAAMGGLIAVFSGPLIGLFTVEDAEMMRLGQLCIILQCIALPIHGWVAIVNMLCGSIGYGFGVTFLAIARQGTCFLPIVFPMAALFKAEGVCSVQAAADVISLFLALPVLHKVNRMIDAAEASHLKELEELNHA